MQYVGLFKKEKHGFEVFFPDLPECKTFGETLDEAVDQAHEALSLFLDFYQEAGNVLPEPRSKKAILGLPEYDGMKAINITSHGDGSDFEECELVMHTYLLGRIEKYCLQYGVSPADFLSAAARDAIKVDIFAE